MQISPLLFWQLTALLMAVMAIRFAPKTAEEERKEWLGIATEAAKAFASSVVIVAFFFIVNAAMNAHDGRNPADPAEAARIAKELGIKK